MRIKLDDLIIKSSTDNDYSTQLDGNLSKDISGIDTYIKVGFWVQILTQDRQKFRWIEYKNYVNNTILMIKIANIFT